MSSKENTFYIMNVTKYANLSFVKIIEDNEKNEIEKEIKEDKEKQENLNEIIEVNNNNIK